MNIYIHYLRGRLYGNWYCGRNSHTLIKCFFQLANIKIPPHSWMYPIPSPDNGGTYWPISEDYISKLNCQFIAERVWGLKGVSMVLINKIFRSKRTRWRKTRTTPRAFQNLGLFRPSVFFLHNKVSFYWAILQQIHMDFV